MKALDVGKAADDTAKENANEGSTIGYNLETGTIFSNITTEESELKDAPESLEYSITPVISYLL